MSTHDIGPGRDERLGEALRAALGAGDDAAFAARVRAALPREPREATWEVLAAWLRPGLAAAAALMIGLLATFALARPAVGEAPLTEQLLAGAVPAGEVVAAQMWEGR